MGYLYYGNGLGLMTSAQQRADCVEPGSYACPWGSTYNYWTRQCCGTTGCHDACPGGYALVNGLCCSSPLTHPVAYRDTLTKFKI